LIGLQSSRQWTNECTHLVLNRTKITEKVLFAMMEIKPIITGEWLTALQNTPSGNFHCPSESE